MVCMIVLALGGIFILWLGKETNRTKLIGIFRANANAYRAIPIRIKLWVRDHLRPHPARFSGKASMAKGLRCG